MIFMSIRYEISTNQLQKDLDNCNKHVMFIINKISSKNNKDFPMLNLTYFFQENADFLCLSFVELSRTNYLLKDVHITLRKYCPPPK